MIKCPERIIVIGDLHGDDEIFLRSLEICGVVKNGSWIGNDTHVIQIGDTLGGKRPEAPPMNKDYAKRPGEILINKLMLKLDSQARMYNGRVISLIGNHELYPYYYNTDKLFIDQYVKKIDIRMYKKLFNINREKFWKPGNRGGLILSQRPLLKQYGKFLFIHGSVTNEMIDYMESKYKCLDTKDVINEINKDVSNWLKTGKNKYIPAFMKEADNRNSVFSCVDSKNIKNLDYFRGANFIVTGNKPSFDKIPVIRPYGEMSRAFGGDILSNINKIGVIEIIQKMDTIIINKITNSKKIQLFPESFE
tara:strand:+ start:7030 stop:7947 length:918 start_codon:yes stop_codon:yes gene_type:complete